MVNATLLEEPVQPGDARWMQYMTASKIAAVVGLSPFESPFSLWHRMAGNVPAEPGNDETRRGHYLEPAIRAWFADQHPGWLVQPTGTWVNDERPWQAATPDALVWTDDQRDLCAEFKSAHEDDQWGEPGSDDIPVYYRCQVMWQMDTLGLPRCHVAALTRHLEFVEYVVDYDDAESALLRDAASKFLASIAANQQPDVDEHDQTYQVIRRLHPGIDDAVVDVPEPLARDYCQARAELAAATAAEKLHRSRIADLMGNARRARWDTRTIATRQAKADGLPFVVAARNLPTFPANPEAA